MKRLKKLAVLACLTTASVYLAYKLLLTKEAQVSLRNMTSGVANNLQKIKDKTNDDVGQYVDEGVEDRLKQVNEEWEHIGF
ncbi:hypothetical protein [Parafannyhessea umbonata]|uniref:hypothetical protein n=1 Tax=Parafannyhessea umbonata TaxID=604330 RepID=UPI00117F7437|nr:hypothetical protein [Parafannyhessea umbonata]